MLYFTIQNRLQAGTSKVSEAAGARWRFYRRIILGYRRISSDYPRIVFLLAEAFREYPLKSWALRFRGRRNIWWGSKVTLLAPRIGNEVSYVMQIIDDMHFAWQAQYLVTAQVLMVVASIHKFKERGVTTVVHCSSGHEHVTYLRVFFFPSVSQ